MTMIYQHMESVVGWIDLERGLEHFGQIWDQVLRLKYKYKNSRSKYEYKYSRFYQVHVQVPEIGTRTVKY